MNFPTPVLLGADLNCYQLARLLHENYGVTSYAFGRYKLGETNFSKIVTFCEIPTLWEEAVLLSVLEDFAKEHPHCLLFGCTDTYVRLIVKNKKRLPSQFLIPYGDQGFHQLASNKYAFGGILSANGIPTPHTEVWSVRTDLSLLQYPLVLKAANSDAYFAHPFPDMNKAYLVQDAEAVKKIAESIRAAGYAGEILLQDYIPGDDSAMYVANGYVDREGHLRQLAIGHVLLQEHTPKGIGNPCAILTEPMPQLEALVKQVVAVCDIQGLFNLDIRYDHRDNTYKVLECNPRQGRSAYSTCAAGLSPIETVIEDLVYQRPFERTRKPSQKGYWHSVPSCIVKRHIPSTLWKEVKACKQSGAVCETLRYGFDLNKNYKRRQYLLLHNLSHIKKFYMYDKNRSASL